MQAELLMMSAGPGCLGILLALLAAAWTPQRRSRTLPLRSSDDAGPRLEEQRTPRNV